MIHSSIEFIYLSHNASPSCSTLREQVWFTALCWSSSLTWKTLILGSTYRTQNFHKSCFLKQGAEDSIIMEWTHLTIRDRISGGLPDSVYLLLKCDCKSCSWTNWQRAVVRLSQSVIKLIRPELFLPLWLKTWRIRGFLKFAWKLYCTNDSSAVAPQNIRSAVKH